MKTIDFYNFAVMAAKERGYSNPNITVHTLCDSNGIKHICKLWDNDKKKHISSTLQNNPVSAIQAFKVVHAQLLPLIAFKIALALCYGDTCILA